MAPELGGGRTGRSWRGRSSPVNLLLGELYGEGLMSPEALNELGDPLNRRSRLAPAVAEDKIAGDHFPVVAGHRGGDESVLTSGRISTACALGQLACAGGLGGASAAESAVDAGVLPRRRCRVPGRAWRVLERGRVPGVARQASRGQRWEATRAAVRRVGVVRAHAKRALWARPEHARQVLDGMPAWSRARGWSRHCTG